MRYPGGKNGSGSWQRIISEITPCSRFVELFAGSAPVGRNMRPAKEMYMVDLDLRALMAIPANYYRICMDALHFLAMWTTQKGDFFYVDPPYLFSTRRSALPFYRHEFGEDWQHEALLWQLRRLDCCVAISGYDSQLYRRLLTGWRFREWPAMTRHGVRMECLWMNYPTPALLQDGRYVGGSFTDRQRLRRRAGVEKR